MNSPPLPSSSTVISDKVNRDIFFIFDDIPTISTPFPLGDRIFFFFVKGRMRNVGGKSPRKLTTATTTKSKRIKGRNCLPSRRSRFVLLLAVLLSACVCVLLSCKACCEDISLAILSITPLLPVPSS